MIEQDSTLDAFHRGDFWIVQPALRGHRAGTDAMMLAASVPTNFAGRLADFGAGAGAAGLAVASRCKGANVLLVERSPEMADFAERTLAHERNAHLRARAGLLVADVALAGHARGASGLTDNGFDFVLMNPPFNEAQDRPSPDTLRRDAHVMEPDLWARWIRSAAAVTRPRGGLGIIARPVSLPVILETLRGRYGGAAIVPIHPRPDQAAIRIVVRAWRGSRAALSLQPPLFLHEDSSHAFGARADALNNGRASLFGD
ncbi:methyltransferase [Mesorhizobium sp. RP14(2022)]|uniref:Methyltransferase n=1 Tax=Mesorhizobium liriopis TaxID=2953882 RepID=A0ABT1C0Z7_9HYPH|nr:methyltransferase [Mesorhizobium liriopis]MCO6048513.1 methyltransferase [Mesorhizobium liriopis]